MANIGQFFGDVASSALGVPNWRERQQKNAMTLNDQAIQTANQFGELGSKEWADAYRTVATNAGLPSKTIDAVTKLAANKDMLERARLLQDAQIARTNYNPQKITTDAQGDITGLGGNISPNIAQRLDALSGAGAMLAPQVGPQSKMVRPEDGQYDMTTGRQIVNGQPTGFIAPNHPSVRSIADRPGRAGGSMGASFVQGGNAPPLAATNQGVSQFFGNAVRQAAGVPQETQGAGDFLKAAAGVTPEDVQNQGSFMGAFMNNALGQAPKTMDDVGIKTKDQAEQFSTLESMIGDALPGFDLRADYQREPAFYTQLFKAIQQGVPDEKDPTKKRKLSAAEIIQLIRG